MHSLPGPSPSTPGDARTLESEEILNGRAEVAIRHNGRLYRLRNTRNGKLILT